MLQRTLIDLQFTEGADNKTDNKNTAFSTFTTLKNSRYHKKGIAVPRGGFSNFSNLPNTGTSDIIADNDYIIAKNGNQVYTVGVSGTTNFMGREVSGGFKRLYGGDATPNSGSVAAYNNYVVHAWVSPDNATTGQIGIAIYDSATGRTLSKGTSNVGTINNLQLVQSGFAVYLICETSTFQLRFAQLNLSSPTSSGVVGSISAWTNSPTGTTSIRWASKASGSNIYIAYSLDNSAVVKLQVFSSFASAPVGTDILNTSDPARGISLTPVTTQSTATVMVAAISDGSTGSPVVKAGCFNAAAAVVGTVSSMTHVYGATTARCLAYETDLPVYGVVTNGSTTTLYVVTSSSITQKPNALKGAVPTSGSNTTNIIMTDTYTEVSNGSQGLVSLTNGVNYLASVVGIMGVGMNLGQYNNTASIQLSNPVTIGTKTYFIAPVVTSIDGFAQPVLSAGTVSKTTSTPKVQSSLIVWDSAELLPSYLERSKQQALYIGTSTRASGVTERTGTPWPEPLTQLSDLAVVTGVRHAAATISYVFAKVWRSAEGVEYRSYSTIYTGSFSITQTLQYTLDFSTYDQPVTRVEVYRTEENGIIFYLANSYGVSGTYTDNSNPSGLTVDPITANRTADLNGNELPPQAIPSVRAITSFGDRIALVSPDKPSTVTFDRPSFYPVGTSSANGLEVDVGAEGGIITALQDMDSALYIFKANDVYTLYGDPPSATGEGSTLSTPKVLFNGIGCTHPRSVILTPKGILFKSGKGFYIIARNQALSFKGEGPFVDASAVTGAVISQNQYEVYFTHASGSIWVLNLDTDTWYEWVSGTDYPRGAAISNGALYVATDFAINSYDDTVTTDPVGSTGQVITTGWLKMGHIRGFQRVRRMYVEAAASQTINITVNVFTDYNSVTPVQTFNLSTTAGDPVQLDLHFAVQKCEAMQIQFVTDKLGLSLSGATLEVGIKNVTDMSRTSASNKN